MNKVKDQVKTQVKTQVRNQVWDQVGYQFWNQVGYQFWAIKENLIIIIDSQAFENFNKAIYQTILT